MKRNMNMFIIILSLITTLNIIPASSSSTPPPLEPTPAEKLQSLYTHPQKSDNYYYTFLGVNSVDLAVLPADQLETALNNALNTKIGTAAGIVDEALRIEIIESLRQAKNLLLDNDQRKLYTTVGHDIFYTLKGQPQLFNYIKTIDNAPEIRKKTLKYYTALLDDAISNPLEYVVNRPWESFKQEKYDALDEHQQLVYRALGHTAFEKLSPQNLQVLKHISEATAPGTDPTPAIFKARINQLLCEIAEGEPCTTDTTAPTSRTGDGSSDSSGDRSVSTDGTREATTTSASSKDASVEAFKKANPKLQRALESLYNAKRYLKGIEKDQRSNIRTKIKNELDDYKAIQSIASQIKQKGESAHAEKRRFAQLVDSIYATAKGF